MESTHGHCRQKLVWNHHSPIRSLYIVARLRGWRWTCSHSINTNICTAASTRLFVMVVITSNLCLTSFYHGDINHIFWGHFTWRDVVGLEMEFMLPTSKCLINIATRWWHEITITRKKNTGVWVTKSISVIFPHVFPVFHFHKNLVTFRISCSYLTSVVIAQVMLS